MKTILIIGGSSGIGRQLVEDLVQKDYTIWVASRTADSADLPDGVHRQEYDVTRNQELELPDTLDGFVYCPGTINLKPFERISTEALQQELEINYLGAVRALHQVIKKLKKSDQASAVFFSTVAVQTGMPFHSGISAAKGAIEGMVRSLAAEYAPKVRFNAIAPSLTDTPLAENLLSSDKKREANTSRHPLKKIGTVRDISAAASYLLSEEAGWITGQILTVDGGMSAIRTL